MDEKAAQVEASLKKAEEIHHAIHKLARKAFLESLGIQNDSSSESGGDMEMEVDSTVTDKHTSLLDDATLHNLLSTSQFNWFEFIQRVECMVDISNS